MTQECDMKLLNNPAPAKKRRKQQEDHGNAQGQESGYFSPWSQGLSSLKGRADSARLFIFSTDSWHRIRWWPIGATSEGYGLSSP
jgi:hypothetical protein